MTKNASHKSNQKLHKSHIAVAQNASGRNLNVAVYRISDGLAGPKVYIQSSIHGSEVQGNVVIYHLIQELLQTTIHGEVVLVPNCNPVGTNIKAGEYTLGRFDPVNGTNWNRGYFYEPEVVTEFAKSLKENQPISEIKKSFKQSLKLGIAKKLHQDWGLGLAQQLNLRLQSMAVDADIVMDLHNGPVSARHAYIPENNSTAAQALRFKHAIFIPNVFAGALDEAIFCPWWSLEDALKNKFGHQYSFGVDAFTLEMGSQETIDFNEGLDDAKNILSFLANRGLISTEYVLSKAKEQYGVSLKDYKTLFTDMGGMVEYIAKPGVAIKKGEPLARILNIDDLDNEKAWEFICAPCNLIPILHFPSASVLSGTQLYKCFTNYFKL